jgi:hypothetical protein
MLRFNSKRSATLNLHCILGRLCETFSRDGAKELLLEKISATKTHRIMRISRRN